MSTTLFTALLLVFVCVILTAVTSSPTPSSPSPLFNNKAITPSPDSKSSSLEDGKKRLLSLKNGLPLRKKKSEEFIQFGNQQNKPAGMVDDALSGMATKKNLDMKRQQNYEELMGPSNDEDETGAENEPLAAFMNGHDKSESDQDNLYPSESEMEGESYMSRGVGLTGGEDEQSSNFRGLREQSRDRYNAREWFKPDDDYSSRRKRRNIIRNDRNIRKRSLRTTAEKLMNMHGGARRWKRDVRDRFHEDEVLSFLNSIAAAELAKEKETRQREFERLPNSEYLWQSRMAFPDDDPSLDGFGLSPDSYGYYYYPGQNFDTDVINHMMEEKESPEVVMFNPEEMAAVKRGFYPAVDYRSLGIVGARKRRRQHQQSPFRDFNDDLEDGSRNGGSWGRIRGGNVHRNESSLRQILGDYNSMEDESDGADDSSESGETFEANNYGGSRRNENEKLHTLGKLLSGKSDADNFRYPVYKRLI